MIIAQGGRFGGWAVFCKDGRLRFVHNVLGIHEFPTVAEVDVPAGTHQVRMEFAHDGGGLARGGDVTLFHDGDAVGTGRVDTTRRHAVRSGHLESAPNPADVSPGGGLPRG